LYQAALRCAPFLGLVRAPVLREIATTSSRASRQVPVETRPFRRPVSGSGRCWVRQTPTSVRNPTPESRIRCKASRVMRESSAWWLVELSPKSLRVHRWSPSSPRTSSTDCRGRWSAARTARAEALGGGGARFAMTWSRGLSAAPS